MVSFDYLKKKKKVKSLKKNSNELPQQVVLYLHVHVAVKVHLFSLHGLSWRCVAQHKRLSRTTTYLGGSSEHYNFS